MVRTYSLTWIYLSGVGIKDFRSQASGIAKMLNTMILEVCA
ncbi:hypothetical protein M6B38_272740 [Iris pallida]|uniref:Uncharacterized protein n=1 Tax=Iris pallida TaxID=29817 RepID=A0AAX6I6L9_IRIPA|nr:hypothetical protein M6B38_272740 [Iris pallida]